jgi:hypothetical protein
MSSDGVDTDQFGVSVDVNQDRAIVGCHLDDDDGTNSGSAYIFSRNEGGVDNWGEVTKLTAPDAATQDHFANSVHLSENMAVVGCHKDDDNGSESGSAYIFEKNTGGTDNWGYFQKLTATDASGSDYFGNSVAISGETALVGAWGESYNGQDAGAAYIFGPGTEETVGCMDVEACNYDLDATSDDGSCLYYDDCTCDGDLNGDGEINTGDILFFLSGFGCLSDCPIDLNSDDYTGTQDLLIFLTLVGVSCE